MLEIVIFGPAPGAIRLLISLGVHEVLCFPVVKYLFRHAGNNSSSETSNPLSFVSAIILYVIVFICETKILLAVVCL